MDFTSHSIGVIDLVLARVIGLPSNDGAPSPRGYNEGRCDLDK